MNVLVYVCSHQGDIRQNKNKNKNKNIGKRRRNFKTWRVMIKSLRMDMSCGDLVILFPYLLSREKEKEIQDLA